MNRRSRTEGSVIQIDGYANIKCNRKILIIDSFSKAEYPSRISSYPSYLESDVALLRLKYGIDLANSPVINSICWPTVTPSVGQQVIATGWGIKFQGLGIYGKSKFLQKVISQFFSSCVGQSSTIDAIYRPHCQS